MVSALPRIICCKMIVSGPSSSVVRCQSPRPYFMQPQTCQTTVSINKSALVDKWICQNDSALGLCEIQLQLEENIRPTYCKSRPVPFALREKVNHELERMVNAGYFERVDYS
ncbi:hypothetical protein Ciccas_014535 [Cichlidogyrus casuarinus]|uniref:Uncharacterized protein n=1 Tax=Cichlidogyrus casuarinus TaxID=1844966 RepID=A0ABD2PJK4_9PLAT